MTEEERITPTLVYDGDCGICTEWVQYWRKLTGDRVDYRPYQEAAPDYPGISEEEFREAIQFIDADGTVRDGAAATFRLYRGIPPWSALEWLYSRVPGFAPTSEFFYRFFARRRDLLASLTHLFWGRNMEPARHVQTRWLFLRLLGLIYLAAMVSYAVQVPVLIGSDGILPLASYLEGLHEALGDSAYWRAPMLFWLHAGDAFLQWLPVAGAVLALLLVGNVATRTSLVLLYIIYLSLYYAGQTFMTFQWDLLLLEAGVLAILLTTGSRIAVWLYRWLVFRFMFLGGVVKIVSADPTWDNLTALSYHFETQPLPTPLAWYVHQLPDGILKAAVAATLIIELVLPFFIFAPRRLRMTVAWIFLLFQFAIFITGNYNFFNLLTMAMCLFLFDDAALRRVLPGALRERAERRAHAPRRATSVAVGVVACVLVFSSTELLVRVFAQDRSSSLSVISRALRSCQCVSSYGPFAVMTTERNEIVIEGSADGQAWQEYEFKYKPGDTARRPGWVAPHQPRVDWQMWFAALSPPDRNPWFRNLLVRLLLGSETTASLFEHDPFPDAPPQWVRARYYQYWFTTPDQRAKTGQWWIRQLKGDYIPPIRVTRNPEPSSSE